MEKKHKFDHKLKIRRARIKTAGEQELYTKIIVVKAIQPES